MPPIDFLILTAANTAQARGYTAQLADRQRRQLIPPSCTCLVFPDPANRRAGSGGATLAVLFHLARRLLSSHPSPRRLADLFANQRILLIHSGGDSRRLPAYAAHGKIFTPLPCSSPTGDPATLFDLIFDQLSRLPFPASGGLWIASGDVLVSFDPQEIHLSPHSITGLAYPASLDRGSRHGVYVADPSGRVIDFLQKPDEPTARAAGALDPLGRVLVDTGLLFLTPAAIAAWLQAAGAQLRRTSLRPGRSLLRLVLAARTPAIDLYHHILTALVPHLSARQYLQRLPDPPARSHALQRYHAALLRFRRRARLPFSVHILSSCDFFHIGTTREFLSHLTSLSPTARRHHFANLHHTVLSPHATFENAFLYNTVLHHPRVFCGPGTVLEAVLSTVPLHLPGPNLLVNWPPQTRYPLELPPHWGLVCLPIGPRHWSAVLFGLDDDFKTPLHRGATFGNQPLEHFLQRTHLDPRQLFSRSAAPSPTLWDARLWLVGPIDHVLRNTLWMTQPSAPPPTAWRNAQRLAMSQLLTRVNHARILDHRARIFQLWSLHHVDELLANNRFFPAADVLALIHNVAHARTALARLRTLLEHRPDDFLFHARLYWLIHLIAQRFPAALRASPRPRHTATPPSSPTWPRSHAHAHQLAFAAVARSVAQQIQNPLPPPDHLDILPDQVVWVRCPVRIDLAGGWSDTPPICAELGGAVLNAAITLNNQYPVQVIAKRSDHPIITLHSMDLGRRIHFTRTAQVLDYANPADWAALPKAALVLTGLVPADPATSLKRHLQKLGGGLDITLFSAVPKGSGLGTSSILGAALIACLQRVLGRTIPTSLLIALTSTLEQMITTGGGWQDQIGGITPGVKLICTQPGPDQTPSLFWTHLAPNPAASDALHQRLLLYYTGYRRLAKNILQRVVSRYLAADPIALDIVHRLKRGAHQMKENLDRGDLDAFAAGVEEYWHLKQQLDPGATNPHIEAILRPLCPYLAARLLPGAGGGGFIFMIAKDPSAAQRIRHLLTHHPPNPLARFFDFQIDPHGLQLTVL